MARKVLAVLAGLIGGILSISLLEMLVHSLIIPPGYVGGVDAVIQDNGFSEMFSSRMMLSVLAAYIIGSGIAGFITAIISKSIEMTLVVGALLTIGGVINVSMLPHPIWFSAGSLLTYLPMAWLGGLSANFFFRNHKSNHIKQL